MVSSGATKFLLALVLAVGLVALPNALTAFEECEHCDECIYSQVYEVCAEFVDCDGLWCEYQGPSSCICEN